MARFRLEKFLSKPLSIVSKVIRQRNKTKNKNTLRQYRLLTFMKVKTNGILHSSTTAISKNGKPAIKIEDELSRNPILSVLERNADTDTNIEIIKPIHTAITSTVQARRIKKVE